MNLDGVINAKAEIFQRIFGFKAAVGAQGYSAGAPLFLPEKGTPAFRTMYARNDAEPDPRRYVALGVYRPSDSGDGTRNDLRLGVFVQRKKLMEHPLVDKMRSLVKAECKVIYTGPVRKRAVINGRRYDRLRMGCSVGHYRVTAGTLGAFAVKRDGGGIGILSNNHVLADTNRGKVGDVILHPAKHDGGARDTTLDHIALLHKFEPLNFEPGASNLVDCAFAYLKDKQPHEPNKFVDPENPAQTITLKLRPQPAEDGTPVKKIGRTTGLTYGVVDATDIENLTVDMVFGASKKTARFDGQIAISGLGKAFSKPGDSGSLILSEANAPVGLLFAGSEAGGSPGGLTFANPISTVCDALDIELYFGS